MRRQFNSMFESQSTHSAFYVTGLIPSIGLPKKFVWDFPYRLTEKSRTNFLANPIGTILPYYSSAEGDAIVVPTSQVEELRHSCLHLKWWKWGSCDSNKAISFLNHCPSCPSWCPLGVEQLRTGPGFIWPHFIALPGLLLLSSTARGVFFLIPPRRSIQMPGFIVLNFAFVFILPRKTFSYSMLCKLTFFCQGSVPSKTNWCLLSWNYQFSRGYLLPKEFTLAIHYHVNPPQRPGLRWRKRIDLEVATQGGGEEKGKILDLSFSQALFPRWPDDQTHLCITYFFLIKRNSFYSGRGNRSPWKDGSPHS